MPSPGRNRLPDPVPVLEGFEGIVNVRRSKDIGYGGLVTGRNIEVTDTKKLVRRDGYTKQITAAFTALYGSANEQQLLAVSNGDLLLVKDDVTSLTLASGLLNGAYCWSEDPAGNIFYTSNVGNSGIVMGDNTFMPLALAVPTISSAAVVTTDPWVVTPFNLGKKYIANVVELFATYLYPDGRESAPSGIASVPVAPEVALLRVGVPVLAGCRTLVYATAPGGTRYHLVVNTDVPVFTFPVKFLHTQSNSALYPYTTALSGFPTDAYLLAHWGGKLHAAVYDPASRVGAIYVSLPLQYHLFNPIAKGGFISVAGAPLLLLSLPDDVGLLIGTDSNIYLWNGEKLKDLANYGVVPGVCGDVTMEGKACFWTLRGIAKAMPYELVTEKRYSADPGQFNHAKIFYDRGYAKLVASTISGSPVFNKWSSR